MGIEIDVQESEETRTPVDRYHSDIKSMIAGAVLVHCGTNRDLWETVLGRNMEQLNNAEINRKIYGNSEEDLRTKIAEKYPVSPSGTYRVTEIEEYYYTEKKPRGWASRYQIKGFAVMKKNPIARPRGLKELRSLSLQAGSLMVPRWTLRGVVDRAIESGEWRGASNDIRGCMRSHDFTANQSGDFFQVRYNPKYFNSKAAMSKYRTEKEKYDHLMQGQPPNELIHNILNQLKPRNWSNFPHLSKDQKRTLNFVSDTTSEVYLPEWSSFDQCLKAIAIVFGKRCRSYRKLTDWKTSLKVILPYMAGMREKYGVYTTKEGRYKVYRDYKQNNFSWATADAVWRGTSMRKKRNYANMLLWLEKEIKAAKLKIPTAPEPPVHPRNKRAKKNESKHRRR